MKFNRFYNISPSASPSDEQVFYYKRIWFDNIENNPDKNQKPYTGNVTYPFYVIIKPYQLEFNYYGPPPAINMEHSEYSEKEQNFQLYHRTLFSLTLSDNYSVNNKFAADLINLYDEAIDLSHLMQNKKANVLHIDDLDFKSDNDKYFRAYYISYASIHQDFLPKDEPYRKSTQNGKIPYRLLFLDFLFDFMEVEKRFSDFAYSPYLDEVAQRLLDNHFFFSIATKYSYYYRKQILLDKLKGEGTGIDELTSKLTRLKDVLLSNKHFEIIENILSRRRELTPLMAKELQYRFSDDDFVKSDQIIQYFKDEKNWKTQEELKEKITVYFKTGFSEGIQKDYGHLLFIAEKFYEAERKWLKALYKEDENIAINEDNNWFENLEIENERVFDIEKTNPPLYKDPIGWTQQQLTHSQNHNKANKLLEFSAYLKNNFKSFYSRERSKIDESATWHLSRYNIIKAFRLYSPLSTFFINLFVFGILVLTTMQFIFFFRGETNRVFNNHLLIATVIGLALVLGISLFALLKSLLVYLCSFLEQRRMNHLSFLHKLIYSQNKFSARVIGFFMPKLLMAIMSGWVILLTAEALWKTLFDVKAEIAFHSAFILLIILLVFISVEVQKIKPILPIRKVLYRTLVLLAFGIFYSSSIGLLAMSFSSERVLTRSAYLENYYKGVVDDTREQYMDIDPESKQRLKDLLQKNVNVAMVNDTLVMKLQFNNGQGKDTLSKNVLLTFSNDNKKSRDNKPIIAKGDSLYQYLDSLVYRNNETSKLVYKPKESSIPLLNRIDLKIFPGMLLIETVIALFIGIFLHLLFDRRKIVEPI